MLCVALDHGFTMPPDGGLLHMADTLKACGENGASAVLVHKGFAALAPAVSGMGLIVHLSGSTLLSIDPRRKVIVSSVESALRHGADAISIHVNIGSDGETSMLQELGRACDLGFRFGIPLLAMMYPPLSHGGGYQRDSVTLAHIARVAQECGAAIVKIPLPQQIEELGEVVRSVTIPLVIAGGDIQEPRDVLMRAYDAIRHGAIGVSFGRGIYRNSFPGKMVSALREIIFNEGTVEASLAFLTDQQPSNDLWTEGAAPEGG